MLDFVNNIYEVTEENKDALFHLMDVENICNYHNEPWSLVKDKVEIGDIFLNTRNNNPKQTGAWFSKQGLSPTQRKQIITKLPNMVMTIE